MTHFGHCPACGTEISHERQFDGITICECGWTSSVQHDNAQTKMNDRVCISIAFFAALLVGSFIQVVNWDSYSITIIPLKVKQISAIATVEELNQIAEICLDRKKLNCTEEAYQQIFELDSEQHETLAKLGELQIKRGHMADAVKTYDRYFGMSSVRPSLDSQFQYAKALAATSQTKKAEKYFKRVLKAKPDVLQITVTRHYIQMLVENEEFSKAKATLEHFRKQGTNTKMFMEKEYREIKQKLKRNVASSF